MVFCCVVVNVCVCVMCVCVRAHTHMYTYVHVLNGDGSTVFACRALVAVQLLVVISNTNSIRQLCSI